MATTIKEICPEMWQLDSGKEGLTLTVLGGVHGNEFPGIKVVQNLLRMNLISIINRGKLNIGIGNPKAVEDNGRFAKNDFDLNRSFGDVPKQYADSIAVRRALELKPILSKTDVLIDIHSTTQESEPMLLSPNSVRNTTLKQLLPLFDSRNVLTGEGLAAGSTGVTTDAFVWTQGGLGIAIETGQRDDVSVVPRVEQSILQTMNALKISAQSFGDVTLPKSQVFYDAYWSVEVPDKPFALTKKWQDFEFLPAGTVFAVQDGENITVVEDSYIVFPKNNKEQLKPGVEACLMLRKIQE